MEVGIKVISRNFHSLKFKHELKMFLSFVWRILQYESSRERSDKLYSGENGISKFFFTGLSPDLQSMEQIRRIMRPTDVPDQGKAELNAWEVT